MIAPHRTSFHSLVMIDVIFFEGHRRWNTQRKISDVTENAIGDGPMITKCQIVPN